MKTLTLRWACALCLVSTAAQAKPPGSTPKDGAKKPGASPTPAAGPETAPVAEAALARWLVQAPTGADAITLPFAQVLTAATGKRVLPFDPANPTDAATLAKLGAVLDGFLPRINRPDSGVHAAAAGGEEAACAWLEAELRTALPPPARPAENPPPRSFPACVVTDAANGRTYSLALAISKQGSRGAPAFTFRPGAAGGVEADGCCLLVNLEYNGKLGPDIAFLNWQVIDLARLKVAFAPVFEAAGPEPMPPSAVLTDGRKGRD